VGVLQQRPATRSLPPQGKALRLQVGLASIFAPRPERPWQSGAARVRSGVAPFVPYRGVPSDGAGCGDVMFVSVVFAFPSRHALGF